MKKYTGLLLIVLILASLIAAGCSQQTEEVPETAAVKSIGTIPTPEPTPKPSIEITSSPTPEPSEEPLIAEEEIEIPDAETPTEEESSRAEESEEILPLSGIVIGIDPGHQEHGNSEQEPQAPGSGTTKAKVSSGTEGVNTGTPEYQINLAVGRMLRTQLEELGATVIMTHDTADVDISNKERATMMNNAEADLVVRLHCDGIDDHSVHGALMLVPTGPHADGFEEESLLAGEAILNAFIDETGAANRGISKRDDQTGFNWSTVPVCNMEMGCLSNPDEEALLITEDYQWECARGVRNGILNYFGA